MSISLNAILKTAQDGINHRPVVNLLSSPMESAVPYRGNYFNTVSENEDNGDLIITSTGRLANVYLKDDGVNNYKLYYYYSNTDRTEWQTPTLLYNNDIVQASLCEMTDGNIGIIIVRENYDIGYMIISQIGTIITGYTAIATGNSWVGGISVITLANDTYLFAYALGTGVPPDTGNIYTLQKRTSSNFTSWSSASEITLSGLSSGYYKNNPDLLQITGDRIYLHFDYLTFYENDVEINNIYYVTSDDNGSTWSTPIAVTSITDKGTTAVNPSAAQNEDGSLTLVYQENSNVLKLKNLDGWPDGVGYYPEALSFNQSEERLACFHYTTTRTLSIIDISDNSHVTHYNKETSPGWYSEFLGETLAPSRMFRSGTDDDFLLFYCYNDVIVALNLETEDITYYHQACGSQFDNGNFSLNRSDDSWLGGDYWVLGQAMTRIISENDRRLYSAWYEAHNNYGFSFGYIDLDEVADPITGRYTWHEVKYLFDDESTEWSPDGISDAFWISNLNRWCFMSFSTESPKRGIILMDDDGVIHAKYSYNTNAGMPVGGAIEGVYIKTASETNGSIWFTFEYNASYPDRRGLARLNLDTEVITYHQPNWFTCTSNCNFQCPVDMGDGRIALICTEADCDAAGAVVFDCETFEWTLYNNTTIPGMIADTDSDCDDYGHNDIGIQYDSITGTIYVAYPGDAWTGENEGPIAFSEFGAYEKLKYLNITDPATTPVYGSESNLSYYSFEENPTVAVDGDGYLWLTWNHMANTLEDSLQWANSMANMQVEDYLVDGSVLGIQWEVDKPNKLSFELSHGYLFDPLNFSSMWSVYFKMGRLLTLQLGETVSDTDYFQDQGEFIVKESSLSYSQKYPTIKIVAEDLRSPWEDTHIITSEYYSGLTPKAVTESLLVDHGDLVAADYNIPTYNGSHDLYHQFLDMDLHEAIQLILDHFGYFGFCNVDGEFEPRRIRFSGSPDHTYSDSTQIIEFTPDTRYATWTNRIIVTGMSNVYSEVIFELESIKSVSGTVGHWGGDKDLTIYYSDDKQRTCRNPRLEIIMSVSEFEVWGIKGGGSEEISGVDDDEHYVIITVEIPDLAGLLIATVAALLALGLACLGCDAGVFFSWCGACIFAITVLLNLLCLILGAVARYSYRIWARPIGHERATFQAQADDEEFQQQLNGRIVTETIDDPFCYVISSCQTVADFELEVVKAQRSRAKFKKTGHLMDEIGDIIRFNHPYSAEQIDMFITKLKRTVKIGAEIIDQLEGWRLS